MVDEGTDNAVGTALAGSASTGRGTDEVVVAAPLLQQQQQQQQELPESRGSMAPPPCVPLPAPVPSGPPPPAPVYEPPSWSGVPEG